MKRFLLLFLVLFLFSAPALAVDEEADMELGFLTCSAVDPDEEEISITVYLNVSKPFEGELPTGETWDGSLGFADEGLFGNLKFHFDEESTIRSSWYVHLGPQKHRFELELKQNEKKDGYHGTLIFELSEGDEVHKEKVELTCKSAFND